MKKLSPPQIKMLESIPGDGNWHRLDTKARCDTARALVNAGLIELRRTDQMAWIGFVPFCQLYVARRLESSHD
jgi:hypothetical protein